MSQVIENWTAVEGKVLKITPANDAAGFVSIQMDVAQANDVPGHANLIGNVGGKTLDVRVPESAVTAAGIKVGDTVAMHAKRAGTPTVLLYANPNTIMKR